MFKKSYTFDDIALVPQFNNISSRLEPDLSTWITKDLKTEIPIIPSNMDSVIGPELARIFVNRGGVVIFHRFTSNTQIEEWAKEFKDRAFISLGVPKDPTDMNEIEFVCYLKYKYNIAGICFDIAHGHSYNMMKRIECFKSNIKDIRIIAGNVCTEDGYTDLVAAGADSVKVGVGPGAACSTRIVTGFGTPQFSAIYNICQKAKKYSIPVIADGGIRNSGDIVKALAAGATCVMIGKMLALTNESAAIKKNKGHKQTLFANYRGQASEEFQKEFYGHVKPGTSAEGVSSWEPVTGSARSILDNLLGGIRSGMTYGGAKTIKELQRKAEFVEVMPSYIKESNPR
jgi:IMP dehydrogenase